MKIRNCKVLSTTDILSSSTTANLGELRKFFEFAKPFKHVCIDNFLTLEFANALLQEFPKFEDKYAMDEHGKIGGKAVRTDLGSLGATYQQLEAFVHSKEFLDYMSSTTGIPGLVSDPQMYGGGTHENLHGQELDPHVDFNYNYQRSLHRRVNLLIYLNREWKTEWGGAIELHSNPRERNSNTIVQFDCVLIVVSFLKPTNARGMASDASSCRQTNGTSRESAFQSTFIAKNARRKKLRRSIGTFYVQRPLPDRISAGHTLSADDVAEIQSLIKRRDDWIAFYQKLELRKQAEIETLAKSSQETIEKLSQLVKQQNDEVELRGLILDRKRSELAEERQVSSRLREALAKLENAHHSQKA